MKLEPPVEREIRVGSPEATVALQGGFDCTLKHILREAATYEGVTDLREYTEGPGCCL